MSSLDDAVVVNEPFGLAIWSFCPVCSDGVVLPIPICVVKILGLSIVSKLSANDLISVKRFDNSVVMLFCVSIGSFIQLSQNHRKFGILFM